MPGEHLSFDEVRVLQRDSRCAECGGGLLAPHVGNGAYMLRCLKDASHMGIARLGNARKLYNPATKIWEEYDMTTQKPAQASQETTALAIPTTHAGMLARCREAEAIGKWKDKMTDAQARVLVQVALAYRLDPFMSEIIPYQGQPYVTIAGRRRLDAQAGHHPSIRFRALTLEEAELYQAAEALNDGDLAMVCVLTTEHGNTVEGFGRVLARERQQKSEYLPLVTRTIEMVLKRAERRAREMAYGPIAMPAGLGIRILQEGDMVEGEVIRDSGNAASEQPPAQELDNGADMDATPSEPQQSPETVDSVAHLIQVMQGLGRDHEWITRQLGMEGPLAARVRKFGLQPTYQLLLERIRQGDA